MSCNGCRVLRKGCSDDCVLRPCLHWIKSPEAQGNATVFLAKFYGRAGLINLLNAGSDHLRHEIFRSLLYEACGRIINPIYGAAGLLYSGNWERCQAAVEAVLDGGPIMKMSSADDDAAEGHPITPLKGCDIRHLGKNANNNNNNNNRVKVTRNRFKRSGSRSSHVVKETDQQVKFSITGWDNGRTDLNNVSIYGDGEDMNHTMMTMKREPSPDSVSVETDELSLVNREEPSHDSVSVETVELSLVNREEPSRVYNAGGDVEDADLALDLCLGFYPVRRS